MLLNNRRQTVQEADQVAVDLPPTDRPLSLCPCCYSPLLARRGTIKVWHWAHKNRSTCQHGNGETQWHLWMKQIHRYAGWDIEVTVTDADRYFRLDAFHPSDDFLPVREFAHTISNRYWTKQDALVKHRLSKHTLWIFDEDLISARSTYRYGRRNNLLKPKAQEFAQHAVQSGSQCWVIDGGWVYYLGSDGGWRTSDWPSARQLLTMMGRTSNRSPGRKTQKLKALLARKAV